jgi:signal transduction histidine kinase
MGIRQRRSVTHVPAKSRVLGLSISSRIRQLTAVACTAVAVFGFLVAWGLERSRQDDAWVAHTQSVTTALAAYEREIIEAETGQRGYLLMGQAVYLAPYDDAFTKTEPRFRELYALIEDQKERAALTRLKQILQEKFRELRLTIDLERHGHHAAALAIVREGRGRRYTVEFERLAAQIAANETVALAQLQANAARQDANIVYCVVGGGLLAILVIIGVAVTTILRIESSLSDLTLGIGALADGDLARRVNVRSKDEIGRVASAFNAMGNHLLVANQARERVEADLRRSNGDLDQFAYSASHDLKAPLRGIRNLTDWIAEDVAATASADTLENLALVHNRVERLDLLLDGLLNYARIGRSGGRAEDVDVARVVADITQDLAPAAGFSVVVRGELPILCVDRAPFEQVLRNLIGNGLKHQDRGTGTVTVSARDLGSAVEFRVEDDGPGIAAHFHERIFQMFQTLNPRDEREGSGMGLAIVKRTVESYGGSVLIDSAPPRRGSAFVFVWPKQCASAPSREM